MANNHPVEKSQIGTVQLATFENEGENGTFPSTTIGNSYEKDGEWKPTSSYSTKQLAALNALTGEALHVHLDIEKRDRADKDQLDEAA